MDPKSRRLALREATREVHERLDNTVGEWTDLRAYSCYLSAMAAFRSAAEAALLRANWPAEWSYRPPLIADDLQADLMDLGLASPPSMACVVTLAGRSGLLGSLYVLEGSAFGARILRRRASELGLGDAFGARHLGRMVGDGGSWRAYLTLLEAEPAFDAEDARVGAEATFLAALRCFERAARVAA